MKFALTILHTKDQWYIESDTRGALRNRLEFKPWVRVHRTLFGFTNETNQEITREVRTSDVRAFQEV